jgi:ATP-dependent Clp protease adapter protein ClpS
MKNLLEYDMSDDLDSARYTLITNVMFIMDKVTVTSAKLNSIIKMLNNKQVNEAEFVKEVIIINKFMNKELQDAFSTFLYIHNEGKCNDCVAAEYDKESIN